MEKAPVQIKRDTSENWSKAKNYKPDFGTLIVYEDDGAISQLKLGDGINYVNDLPDLIKNRKTVQDGNLIL